MSDQTIELNVFLGAHRTGAEHLRKLVSANASLLDQQKIHFPKPENQEDAIKVAMKALDTGKDPVEVRSAFLAALCESKRDVRRVVMINQDLCGTVTRPSGGALLYPRLRTATQRLRAIMHNQRFRLFLALRDPASFFPSCYSEALMRRYDATFEEFMAGTDLDALRWSDCIDRLNKSLFNEKAQKYHAGIFTWRLEDYPKIWRNVFYALSGVPNPMDIKGTSAPINKGLSLYGCRKMYEFLQSHQMPNKGAFEKVAKEFLARIPSDGPQDKDPFWTDELKGELSYRYEDDWYFVERQENTRALSFERLYD